MSALCCSSLQRRRGVGGVTEMFLFVWWMSCAYNGRALPLQINQTWHCPALKHLGCPRDGIKGPPRPWTLSAPNTHSKHENGYPAHFSHHHLHLLCLLVISYFCWAVIPSVIPSWKPQSRFQRSGIQRKNPRAYYPETKLHFQRRFNFLNWPSWLFSNRPTGYTCTSVRSSS